MHPVALFPFHYEVSKTCRIGFVITVYATKSKSWVAFGAVQGGLLLHHFDLPVEYLAGETVDGNVDPVMLFPFHNEIVLQTGSIWLVVARLRYKIDYHVPHAGLGDGRNRARNHFPLRFNRLLVVCCRRQDCRRQCSPSN